MGIEFLFLFPFYLSGSILQFFFLFFWPISFLLGVTAGLMLAATDVLFDWMEIWWIGIRLSIVKKKE